MSVEADCGDPRGHDGSLRMPALPAIDLHDEVRGERHRFRELAKEFGTVRLLFNEHKNHLGCYAGAMIHRS